MFRGLSFCESLNETVEKIVVKFKIVDFIKVYIIHNFFVQ